MTDLAAKRSEAEAKLDDLQRRRGVALLDGKPFADGDLIEAERMLSAIEAAEGEAHRRSREAAAVGHEVRLAELRKALADQHRRRQSALGDAEMACRRLAEALGETMRLGDAMARTFHAITGKPTPGGMGHGETARRLAYKFGIVMGSVAGHGGEFGGLRWQKGPYPKDGNWADAEERLLKPHLDKILKGKTNGAERSSG